MATVRTGGYSRFQGLNHQACSLLAYLTYNIGKHILLPDKSVYSESKQMLSAAVIMGSGTGSKSSFCHLGVNLHR